MNSKFLSIYELKKLNFKKIGNGIKISRNVTIIGEENISLGSNVRIDDYTIISAKEGYLKVGDNVHVGGLSYLGCAGGLEIEDEVHVSQGVKFYTKINDYGAYNGDNDKFFLKKIKIEKKVIIGSNSVILGSIIVGQGCTIGALSFVKKDLKKWSVYGGNPIKFIKIRKR